MRIDAALVLKLIAGGGDGAAVHGRRPGDAGVAPITGDLHSVERDLRARGERAGAA